MLLNIESPTRDSISIAAMDPWTLWASPSSIFGLDQATLDAVTEGRATESQRTYVCECLEAARQYLMNAEPSVPINPRKPS